MIKKAIFSVGLLILLAIISVGLGLIVLWHNRGSYADYWKGRANRPGDFIYVALGDSAAQGLGASKPENGYVGLLAKQLEQTTHRKVRVINLSVTGATLQDALREQIPQLEKIKPDLVTAEIGANDMRTFDKSTFSQNYEQFLLALPPGKSVVSDMPYFGTRPASNQNARQANAVIREQAVKRQIPVADLFDSLKEQQSPLIYASDFFHPNNRGYRIWYDAFWSKIDRM